MQLLEREKLRETTEQITTNKWKRHAWITLQTTFKAYQTKENKQQLAEALIFIKNELNIKEVLK